MRSCAVTLKLPGLSGVSVAVMAVLFGSSCGGARWLFRQRAVEALDVEVHGQQVLVRRRLTLLQPQAAVLLFDRTGKRMQAALGDVGAGGLGECNDVGGYLLRPGRQRHRALRNAVPDIARRPGALQQGPR